MIIIIPKLYTIDILYFIPHSVILNEFCWQTLDTAPKFPRIHRFLKYWEDEHLATIAEIKICDCENRIEIKDLYQYD